MDSPQAKPQKPDLPKKNWPLAIAFFAIGLALASGGFYVGETDDSPGAALLGVVLMVGAFVLGARFLRRRR